MGRLDAWRDRQRTLSRGAFVDIPPCAKEVVLVGDLHGDVFALERVLEAHGPSDDTLLVFLGDYVDRTPQRVRGGALSLVLALADLEERHPETVILRGNHDIGGVMECHPHTWPGELQRRLGRQWSRGVDRWKEIAMGLPLVARTWNGVLAAHGGFPRTLPFGSWDRYEMDDEVLMLHTVWADPGGDDAARGLPSGTNFSREELAKVLREAGCGCFVRGHQSSAIGTTRWDGRVLTLSTAGYYAEQGRGPVLVARSPARARVGSAADLIVMALNGESWERYRPYALPDA
jgi:hypothetical protein